MMRRNVFNGESDHAVVKWTLVAAVFALSVGCFAEVSLAARPAAPDAAVVENVEPVQPALQLTQSS